MAATVSPPTATCRNHLRCQLKDWNSEDVEDGEVDDDERSEKWGHHAEQREYYHHRLPQHHMGYSSGNLKATSPATAVENRKTHRCVEIESIRHYSQVPQSELCNSTAAALPSGTTKMPSCHYFTDTDTSNTQQQQPPPPLPFTSNKNTAPASSSSTGFETTRCASPPVERGSATTHAARIISRRASFHTEQRGRSSSERQQSRDWIQEQAQHKGLPSQRRSWDPNSSPKKRPLHLDRIADEQQFPRGRRIDYNEQRQQPRDVPQDSSNSMCVNKEHRDPTSEFAGRHSVSTSKDRHGRGNSPVRNRGNLRNMQRRSRSPPSLWNQQIDNRGKSLFHPPGFDRRSSSPFDGRNRKPESWTGEEAQRTQKRSFGPKHASDLPRNASGEHSFHRPTSGLPLHRASFDSSTNRDDLGSHLNLSAATGDQPQNRYLSHGQRERYEITKNRQYFDRRGTLNRHQQHHHQQRPQVSEHVRRFSDNQFNHHSSRSSPDLREPTDWMKLKQGQQDDSAEKNLLDGSYGRPNAQHRQNPGGNASRVGDLQRNRQSEQRTPIACDESFRDRHLSSRGTAASNANDHLPPRNAESKHTNSENRVCESDFDSRSNVGFAANAREDHRCLGLARGLASSSDSDFEGTTANRPTTKGSTREEFHGMAEQTDSDSNTKATEASCLYDNHVLKCELYNYPHSTGNGVEPLQSIPSKEKQAQRLHPLSCQEDARPNPKGFKPNLVGNSKRKRSLECKQGNESSSSSVEVLMSSPPPKKRWCTKAEGINHRNITSTSHTSKESCPESEKESKAPSKYFGSRWCPRDADSGNSVFRESERDHSCPPYASRPPFDTQGFGRVPSLPQISEPTVDTLKTGITNPPIIINSSSIDSQGKSGSHGKAGACDAANLARSSVEVPPKIIDLAHSGECGKSHATLTPECKVSKSLTHGIPTSWLKPTARPKKPASKAPGSGSPNKASSSKRDESQQKISKKTETAYQRSSQPPGPDRKGVCERRTTIQLERNHPKKGHRPRSPSINVTVTDSEGGSTVSNNRELLSSWREKGVEHHIPKAIVTTGDPRKVAPTEQSGTESLLHEATPDLATDDSVTASTVERTPEMNVPSIIERSDFEADDKGLGFLAMGSPDALDDGDAMHVTGDANSKYSIHSCEEGITGLAACRCADDSDQDSSSSSDASSSDESDTDEEEIMMWASRMFGTAPPKPRYKLLNQSSTKKNAATDSDHRPSGLKVHLRLSLEKGTSVAKSHSVSVEGDIVDLVKLKRSKQKLGEHRPVSTHIKVAKKVKSKHKLDEVSMPKIPGSGLKVRGRRKKLKAARQVPDLNQEEPAMVDADQERRNLDDLKRKKDSAKPLTADQIKSILGEDDEPVRGSANWVRRSVRRPMNSFLNSKAIQSFFEKLRKNAEEMVVLKMKKYINDPAAPQVVLDAALDALEENANCEALYIQVSPMFI